MASRRRKGSSRKAATWMVDQKKTEVWSRLKSAENAQASVKMADGREIKMPRGELGMRNLLRRAISGEGGPRRELVRKILEIDEAGHLVPLPPKPRQRRKKLDATELKRLERSMDLYAKAFSNCLPQQKEKLRPEYERRYCSGNYVERSIVDYEHFPNSSGTADGENSDVPGEIGAGERPSTYAIPEGICRNRTREPARQERGGKAAPRKILNTRSKRLNPKEVKSTRIVPK